MTNKDRPRMSAPVEARLAPLEERSAACYSALEQMTAKFDQLAVEIEEAEESVPELIEDEEDSMTHHLEELARAAVPPPDPPRPKPEPRVVTEYAQHKKRRKRR